MYHASQSKASGSRKVSVVSHRKTRQIALRGKRPTRGIGVYFSLHFPQGKHGFTRRQLIRKVVLRKSGRKEKQKDPETYRMVCIAPLVTVVGIQVSPSCSELSGELHKLPH